MSASSLKVKGMHCKLKTHKFAFVDNVKGKLKRKVRMVFVVQENKMQHRWSNSLCQVTRGCVENQSGANITYPCVTHALTNIHIYTYYHIIILYYIISYFMPFLAFFLQFYCKL